ncbi:MAG: AAA family ATPase [Desulfosalsimonadaceae bacterium]|nr:AAA family ATPase [Desulfosalsimonadaceae bacterium]
MIPRHIQSHLHTLLSYFPCVVLTGVRQCGKTTLLDTLSDEWQRFDMENSTDRLQLLADPDLFFRLHADKIIIDEAQLAPPLFSALRVAIDRDRSRKGRFCSPAPVRLSWSSRFLKAWPAGSLVWKWRH